MESGDKIGRYSFTHQIKRKHSLHDVIFERLHRNGHTFLFQVMDISSTSFSSYSSPKQKVI